MNEAVLFILTCSNHKERGGSRHYDLQRLFMGQVPPGKRYELMESRKEVLLHIHTGGLTREGKKQIDLPYNRHLCEGPDFDGKENASYLPAKERYIGRLYKEISSSSWERRQNHILILSGLYGLVTPEESVQLYSFHIKDSRNIYDMWKPYLTGILSSYIEKNTITVVVDSTAEYAYRSLINWKEIQRLARVYHVLGDQNAGPALLEAIGDFMERAGLRLRAPELMEIFRDLKMSDTRYERLHFVTDVSQAKTLGLPLEEVEEIEKRERIFVPPEAQLFQLEAISGRNNIKISYSYRVLEQMLGLPKKIQEKIPGVLHRYIRNHDAAGLHAEKIKIGNDVAYRIRIDPFYRIHLEPWDKDSRSLVIRAIGGHRLEGVG